MGDQATILLVRDEALYDSFKERIASSNHRVQFAANLIEARRHYQRFHPWLLMVPLDEARPLLSLLRKARRNNAMVLGLVKDGGLRSAEWADALASQGDVDEVSKVASAPSRKLSPFW